MLPSPYRLPPRLPRARHETLVEKVLLLVGWSALMTTLYLALDPRHSPDYAPVRADLVAPAARGGAAEEGRELQVMKVYHPVDLRGPSGWSMRGSPGRR